MLSVVTCNVNGIRAAVRRGGLDWLASADVDVICLQEVRANDDHLAKALADGGLEHLFVAHAEGDTPGRAGVAILTKQPMRDVRIGLDGEFTRSGRWIEASVDTEFGVLTVVSVYVFTGEANTDRQAQKFRFLDAMTLRMTQLEANAAKTGGHAIVCGDLNVARDQRDIRNWRGNVGKSGFLPQEQGYLERWFDRGWHDLVREKSGDVDGPYTWWSWRGRAWDTDAGWRIDYQLATGQLAHALKRCPDSRADRYDERWSDHAPVLAQFAAAESL